MQIKLKNEQKPAVFHLSGIFHKINPKRSQYKAEIRSMKIIYLFRPAQSVRCKPAKARQRGSRSNKTDSELLSGLLREASPSAEAGSMDLLYSRPRLYDANQRRRVKEVAEAIRLTANFCPAYCGRHPQAPKRVQWSTLNLMPSTAIGRV
ncbi:hypothetical protein FITA111629_14420 [Filibacter tadaridae]|uniref:Uncharacterized protein n=1 Tax=Filibacter tadaridae TaxID=2483811 RepID=A0A3P5WQN1_9BACL|nr:hypothetical protein FILTAD_00983 [Filibacter tadaridae]